MPTTAPVVHLSHAGTARAPAYCLPDPDRWARLHAVEPVHPGVRQIGTVDVVRLWAPR